MVNRLLCLQPLPSHQIEEKTKDSWSEPAVDRWLALLQEIFRQGWPGHNRHSTIRSEPEQPSVVRQATSQREPRAECLAAEPPWFAEN